MALAASPCTDRVVLDMWHPIGALEDTKPGRVNTTQLLGEPVSYTLDPDGRPVAWRAQPALRHGMPVSVSKIDDRLPVIDRYCHIWTSYGGSTRPAVLHPRVRRA